jgi:hypothetical protein
VADGRLLCVLAERPYWAIAHHTELAEFHPGLDVNCHTAHTTRLVISAIGLSSDLTVRREMNLYT